VFPKDEEQDEIVARVVENFREKKIEGGVWATPGLPLLIFVTAGLIIALFYGDIVWILLSSLLA
jgi:prepilin signal peptidase PulO-like enzyme (type II secretory pathway)